MQPQHPASHAGYTPRNLEAMRGEYPQTLQPNDYPLVLAANGTGTTTLTISGGNRYVLETLRAWSTGAFLCMIRDGAGDVALMQKAMHSANLFGTAQRPGFISEHGWEIQPNVGVRELTLELTDLSGSTNTVYIDFVGHRYRTQRLEGRTGVNA